MDKKKTKDTQHVGLAIEVDLLNKLKSIAASEHRSCSKQIIYFIEQGINGSDWKYE